MADKNPPAAIIIRDLTRNFGDERAVDHVNLSISAGHIFGLLGPNGAGKTTTIKMLTTILAPSSGSAFILGLDLLKASSTIRQAIGYVPQNLSADATLTGQENLLLSARLYGIKRSERTARINEALTFMGLSESAHQFVKTYSGGMIRKLELAQAMLHRPKILILDEPTMGLDPIARRMVWERLKELQLAYEMTILITTHDMKEADFLCDELAIMHQGKIAAEGEPKSLKLSLGNDATLDDVFAHFIGGSMSKGGNYRDVRESRRKAIRLR